MSRFFITLSSAVLVGLGQIIEGQMTKGLTLLITFYVAIPFALYTALLLTSGVFALALTFGVIGSIVLWSYSVFDAWRFLTPPGKKK